MQLRATVGGELEFRVCARERMESRSGSGGNEDDDDYMGDLSRFLHPEHLQQQRAPAMATSSDKNAKKLNWQEKRKANQEKKRQTEEEVRSQGLSSAIPSSNIGFKMLQQMGYKPGAALGKSGQGAVEPIRMDLKRSRTGLGVEELERQEKARKAKQQAIQLQVKRMKDENCKKDFQERRRSTWQAGKVYRDYKKATFALAQLDESVDLEKRSKQDSEADSKDDDQEEEEEAVTEEELIKLLESLRTRFHYCIYCGCKYDSAEELSASCPGLDEDAH